MTSPANAIPQNEPHTGRIFFRSFLVCVVLISLPVKNLAYIVPPVYLALEWWCGNLALTRRTLLLLLVLGGISTISMLWDLGRGRTVNAPGMFLAALTFLPLIIVLCERYDRRIDQETYTRMARLCAWFIILQSFVGIGQYLASGLNDAVCGTLGLFDFRSGGITISQVYFTFILFGMMLFIVPTQKGMLEYTALGLGLVTCALAQSGHQIIFFAAALMLLAITQWSRPMVMIAAAGTVVTVLMLAALVYPQTYHDTLEWWRKTVESPNSPRRIVMEGAFEALDDGKNLALGTGLGQFSSRAALITSGDYLSRSLPNVLTGRSDYYRDLVEPANREFEIRGEGSAIAKPYSTWQTLLMEIGPFGVLALVGVLGYGYHQNSRLIATRLPMAAMIGLAANVGLVFFVLCCTIENYAEFPQAVFLPVLLYVAAITRGRQITAEADSSE